MNKLTTIFLVLITSLSYCQTLESLDIFIQQGTSIELTENEIIVSQKTGEVIVLDLVSGQYVKRENSILDLSPESNQVLNEIASSGEQGFLDGRLSPNFDTDSLYFAYYTVNNKFINPSLNDSLIMSISRVTKFKLDIQGNNVVSRETILGDTFADGIPIKINHVGGSLNFLNDGSLTVTTGDGGFAFDNEDAIFMGIISDTLLTRKSTKAMQLNSCNGKVLRIDTNGNGLIDNPFFESSNPRKCKSRVYNTGLRNPYRARVRNDTIFINNVGWANWETINVSSGASQNHGWSLKEGFSNAISGSEINLETGLAFNDTFSQEGLSEDTHWNWKKPLLAYHQNLNLIETENGTESSLLLGNSITGSLPITGNIYSGFEGKYMFTDFFSGQICLIDSEANLEILDINLAQVTDIKEHPVTKEIYFLSISGGIYKLLPETLSVDDVEFYSNAKVIYFDLLGRKHNNIDTLSTGVYITEYSLNGRLERKKEIKY